MVYSVERENFTTSFIYNTTDGIQIVPNVVVGVSGLIQIVAMTPDGNLVANNGPAGDLYLKRQQPSDILRSRAGETVAAWADASGIHYSTVNLIDQAIVFGRAPSAAWHGSDLRAGNDLAATTNSQTITWFDQAARKAYTIYLGVGPSKGSLTIVEESAIAQEARALNNTLLIYKPKYLVPVKLNNGTFGFFMVGKNSLWFVTRTSNPDVLSTNGWAATDIGTSSLKFQGMSIPDWATRPDAYVTSWNAVTIVGIDTNGKIQVVWIAPGMNLWRADNLSDIAGTPKLIGTLTSFVTFWGGVHLAAIDAATGDLNVTWWAPGISWTSSNLSAAAGSDVRLRGDTLTSYVTSWNALNVTGIDSNEQVTTFWWTPTTNQWIASDLTSGLSAETLRPLGKLSNVVYNNELHIVGVGDEGHVVDLFWLPGSAWEIDDLTLIAV